MGFSEQLKALRTSIASARRAKAETGIGLLQQAKEIVALRKNAVGVEDYYYYRLFDLKLHPTMEQKLTYGGWRAFHGEFPRFSRQHLRAVAYEKHLLYRLCQGFGLPVPEIYAVYSPTPNGFERNRALRTQDALRDFLATTERLPLFGKPSNANEGFGGRAVMAREADGRLRMIDGRLVTADELARDIDDVTRKTTGTYLLVEFLRNSEDVRRIAGDAVVSFRTIMLVRDGEPEFFRTAMQLPGAGSHVSNVRYFVGGTVSCGLRPETGEIFLALSGMGFDRREVTQHPITGAQLVGHKIVGWDSLRAVALEASRAMSPFRMQHWDFALTTRGPVIMEMNVIGNVTAVQRHGPPGMYTDQYLSFRRTHAY